MELLRSGEGSDVTAYSKDQKEVRFHSLVARARCPKLLDGAVVERDEDGEERTIVSLDLSEAACHIFFGYLYAARLTREVLKKSDFEGLTTAADKYGLSATFGALLAEKVDQELLVPEEEEDEWDRLNESLPSSSAVQTVTNDTIQVIVIKRKKSLPNMT